jgi:hypothetical protein
LVGVDVWNLPSFREGPTKSGERCFCPYCAETRASRRAASVEQMRDRVMREALAEPYRGRSNILFMTTADASRHVDDGSLDFVFIDADHSTEGVRADINAWRPKIRAGGVLFGHDYNMKSVRDAVQSVYKGWQISLGDDHLWRVNC